MESRITNWKFSNGGSGEFHSGINRRCVILSARGIDRLSLPMCGADLSCLNVAPDHAAPCAPFITQLNQGMSANFHLAGRRGPHPSPIPIC